MSGQRLQIPEAFQELLTTRNRYKVYYGGRGGAKSWAFADALLLLGGLAPLRILCARELQISIADSVHKLLADHIAMYDLEDFYEVQKTTIIGVNGTEFLFKGLKHNAREIKSTEGIDICWVEEAENVSDSSWELLIPTIRKDDAEIWISFNPKYPTDATYQRFVLSNRSDTLVKKVSWRDNPFFNDVLNNERIHMLNTDPVAYNHIWEGEFDERFFGGVYAKWITEAYTAGRVKSNLYDPSLPVHTAWDLGYDDATAIWFWQVALKEVRLINYFEANNEDIAYYCNFLRNRSAQHGYAYGNHYVPHDAANKLLAAGGRSIVDQAYKLGIQMHVVPATSQQNSIEAARKTLEVCWIDQANCKEGIEALKQYQFEYDDDKKIFRSKPKHDWSSHAADAFEIIGQVWSEVKAPAKPKELNLQPPTWNELIKKHSEKSRDKNYY